MNPRPTLKALYLKDGSPSDALRGALDTLRCATLEELQAKVKRGRVKPEDVWRVRLGGTRYRPGVVARYLFGPKRRKVARRIALPPEPDHERAHLALFTD